MVRPPFTPGLSRIFFRGQASIFSTVSFSIGKSQYLTDLL